MTTIPRDTLPALLGRWVTVSNPHHPASWYGRLTALSDDPTLHLTLPGGGTMSLPQAFHVTTAPPPAPGTLAPARQAAYDAVYDLLHLLGPKLPPDPAHRNAMIWRAVNIALDAAGVHVNADPDDPTTDGSGTPTDTAEDTAGDTAPATGGHARTPTPDDGTGCDLTSRVPARPHPGHPDDTSGDTGDTAGDSATGGVRFAYRATVRRNQVHHAITEAFDLLGAELAHQQEGADGRDA